MYESCGHFSLQRKSRQVFVLVTECHYTFITGFVETSLLVTLSHVRKSVLIRECVYLFLSILFFRYVYLMSIACIFIVIIFIFTDVCLITMHICNKMKT